MANRQEKFTLVSFPSGRVVETDETIGLLELCTAEGFYNAKALVNLMFRHKNGEFKSKQAEEAHAKLTQHFKDIYKPEEES